jgi:hypothetical protein
MGITAVSLTLMLVSATGGYNQCCHRHDIFIETACVIVFNIQLTKRNLFSHGNQVACCL